MALTREIVRVNQANELADDPAWAIPLAQNVNVTSVYTGPGLPGFGGFNDVLITAIVDLIQGAGSLQILIQQSSDGSAWTTIATFNFTNDDLVGGGGVDRYLHPNPLDQFRIVATPTAGSRWQLTSITALLGIVETAGGQSVTNVAQDTIWDAKGDLAVGTGPDTATRLAAGTTGYLLAVNPAAPGGLSWVPPSSSGGGVSVSPWWRIDQFGKNEWAPGDSVWDTNLYRPAQGSTLRTDGSLQVGGVLSATQLTVAGGLTIPVYGLIYNPLAFNAASRIISAVKNQGDAQPNFIIQSDGAIYWGPGGAAILDVSLQRSGTNLLLGGGLAIGAADTSLYRLSADNLKTDDSFWALQFVAAQSVYVDYGNTGSRLYFGTSSDTSLYRQSASVLRTDATFMVGGRTWITKDGAGGDIIFNTDVNLYRQQANVLRTDDAMIITGTLDAGYTGTAWGLHLDGSGNLTITGNLSAANFGSTVAPTCIVKQTVPQSLSPQTMTTLTWDFERIDASGMHAPGSSYIVVPQTGVYDINCVCWTTTGGGLQMWLYRNGAIVYRNSNNVGGPPGFSFPLYCAAGDSLYVVLWNDASSNSYNTLIEYETPMLSVTKIA